MPARCPAALSNKAEPVQLAREHASPLSTGKHDTATWCIMQFRHRRLAPCTGSPGRTAGQALQCWRYWTPLGGWGLPLVPTRAAPRPAATHAQVIGILDRFVTWPTLLEPLRSRKTAWSYVTISLRILSSHFCERMLFRPGPGHMNGCRMYLRRGAKYHGVLVQLAIRRVCGGAADAAARVLGREHELRP